ncbi:MAG: ABC transporter permease [Verrucomicrobia bacterium]|nr:ABC transporter permease [Verrucomicrobiota bacterium]
MRFYEIFRLALGSLGANKLRSSLTMLGITIGVFSVISVMTATGALQASIESGLSFLGSNIFQFSKYPAIGGGGPKQQQKYANRQNVTYEQATTYVRLLHEKVPGSIVSLKVFDRGKQVSYGRLTTNLNIDLVGTNENFLISNGYNIELGRNLNPGDVDIARNVAVVGHDIVKRLFPAEDPLGKTIKAAGRNFTIVGTLEAKGGAFGGSQDALVLVPITRLFEDFGRVNRTVNIATQSPSQATYNLTMDTGIGAMRLARGLKPGADNDFEIYSNDSLVGAFASVASAVRAGAFVISSVALLAAGVGIMNIMLVSVAERTKEIGVRKSIGAKKRDILRQFLVESIFLSELGGLVGILLGVIGGNALAAWLKADVIFPYGWAATGVIVCSLIGIGFGFYPAYRAASLDPIEALRYE